jgi:hypothetical protein
VVRSWSIPDVIASPPGEFISETNVNSVAILLTYATARVLLAGDAKAMKEQHSPERFVHAALNGGLRSETTHTLSQGSALCWPKTTPNNSKNHSFGRCAWYRTLLQ